MTPHTNLHRVIEGALAQGEAWRAEQAAVVLATDRARVHAEVRRWNAWRVSEAGQRAAAVVTSREREILEGLGARLQLAWARAEDALTRQRSVTSYQAHLRDAKVCMDDAGFVWNLLARRAAGEDNALVLEAYEPAVEPGVVERHVVERDDKGRIVRIREREHIGRDTERGHRP